ncbi:MAG: 30S ribosomal protein S16 [Candidatus Daviesbacteria bacterium]|nr:30S ribosomal protein S16 [Candidatus Daviesbacteria bacterium]
MLKIRLMRIGAKKKPFYRVVVLDERAKRTGAYIELLGTYNPLTEPKDIKLKQDRIDYWIKQGAQMSTGYLRIIGKAPQRLPRKPKKTRKQATGDSGQVKTEEHKESKETEQVSEEPVKEVAKEETKSEAEKPQEATEVKSDEVVIASVAKQSKQGEDQIQIATEPEAPRDDKIEESEKKDEGSA